MKTEGYYPVSIYLFIIHYFKSKQVCFFFKKFKYLLGTQVRKKTKKPFMLKQRQNISFIFRLKTPSFLSEEEKNESNL